MNRRKQNAETLCRDSSLFELCCARWGDNASHQLANIPNSLRIVLARCKATCSGE